MDHQAVIAWTRRWISSIVIGLNLCPFARRVFDGDKIRYVVSEAVDEATLLADLAAAVQGLASAPIGQIETTLLIHPNVLGSFADYNEFLDAGDQLLDELGMRGVMQIAGFHPDFRFAGVDSLAAENYTNRSPYPMLHLLREASLSAVAADLAEMRDIPQRNIALLKSLGRGNLLQKLEAVKRGN